MTLNRTIALIGFKASGKTTLGKHLAKRWGRRFIDSDQLIEQRHRPLSCSQIHKTFGDVYFRNLEMKVFKEIDYSHPFVLATGGGAIINPHNADLLKKSCLVIYLKSSLHILEERICALPQIPSFLEGGNAKDKLAKIYSERVPLYEKYAEQVIDMDKLTIEEALLQINQPR